MLESEDRGPKTEEKKRGTHFETENGTLKHIQMKRIIYLSLLFSSVLLSCEKIPEAHFHTDTINPEVGHAVLFTSDSKHATRFEWDFGDGYSSNDANPSHIYTGTGPVTVTLKAFSKSG